MGSCFRRDHDIVRACGCEVRRDRGAARFFSTAMQLTDLEAQMLAGELGEPRRLAISQQLEVGRFFAAEDFVPVSQVHLMADGEAVGESGLQVMEALVAHGAEACRFLVPTVTDPRGVDAKACVRLRQPAGALEREERISAALFAMGALLTSTCINYQTVVPPVLGEHLAFGDTGSSSYANSVCGARTNFEGGVAALWAALTGRVPRYGVHLEARRAGTHLFNVEVQPRSLSDWGALGALVGKRMGAYWDVPVIDGIETRPGSDQLKHLAAAVASYGSTPLFHIVGVTPEAPDLEAVFPHRTPQAEIIDEAALSAFYQSFRTGDGAVDLVVFSAPQLSLFELRELAGYLQGRKVDAGTTLIATTSPEVARAAERMGLAEAITDAGGMLLEGVCFYQMYAREIGVANGWRRLVTNSAKLSNILGGYGYEPVLAPMEQCVEAAVKGSLT